MNWGLHVQPTEYSKKDSMSLLHLGYKRHCDFHLDQAVCLSLFLRTLALREASCHVMSNPMGTPMWKEIEALCQ